MADGSVDEPAKLPGTELPRRTIPPGLDRAFLDGPTGFFPIHPGALESQQKERLALRVDGDLSPTLFKALYGFERNAQQLGHLHLSFSQEMSNV